MHVSHIFGFRGVFRVIDGMTGGLLIASWIHDGLGKPKTHSAHIAVIVNTLMVAEPLLHHVLLYIFALVLLGVSYFTELAHYVKQWRGSNYAQGGSNMVILHYGGQSW
jgi:hypothetical protein